MFISHKLNIIQQISSVEWECRRRTKGLSKPEYWTWLDSVTSGNPPVSDYSGETGYTIVKCTDENVQARLDQLSDYISITPLKTTYNIKYYATKRDSEIEGVKSHFIVDDTAKDARLLADEWVKIRAERDRLLANSDWTQGGDTPLTSAKKTAWATYRTKLRDVPKDQKDKTTYASITWPSEPS